MAENGNGGENTAERKFCKFNPNPTVKFFCKPEYESQGCPMCLQLIQRDFLFDITNQLKVMNQVKNKIEVPVSLRGLRVRG